MTQQPTWRFPDFKRQMASTDIDDLINALKNFIDYLQTTETLSDIENNEQIYNIVINCLDTPQYTMISDPIKKHHCLQVLLLLSTRIPIGNLKKFIDKILTRALSKQADALLSDYSLLMVDIFSALVNSDKARQETYIKYAAQRCLEEIYPRVESSSMSSNTPPLMILTSLIENLGTLLTDKQFSNLYDKMISLIENKNLGSGKISYASDLSSLAKIWAVYVNPDLLQKFIKALINQINKESPLAFTVFTTLVISNPLSFSSNINFLIDLYFNKADLLVQKGLDASSEEIKEAEASINALNAVICAFAKWFVSSASSYCELSFDLFTYGVEAPVFQSSSEIHKYSDSEFEVQEEDDDIIDTEPNEDDEFINDDDINNDDEQFGDESYTIRKAINVFAQSLIKYFPDTFMQTFLENEDRQKYTLNFIVDPDSSSKAVSLKTLILFAKSEKSKISPKVLKNWINAFINEINKPAQKDYSIIYSALSELLLVYPDLITTNSLSIVDSILKTQSFNQKTQNKQQQIIIQSMLELFNTIITGTVKTNEITPLICQILIPLINQNTVLQPLLYTSTLLFSKATADSIKPITALNKKIIEISKTECAHKIYAIDPLSVYVCLFSKTDKACASESVSAILNLEHQGLSFHKNALSAIALIASSPSHSIISSVSKKVFAIIQKHISSPSIDPALLYRSLWAFNSCLQGESLFAPKECESIVPIISKYILFNDNRIKSIVITILRNLSSLESVSTNLIPHLSELFISKDILTYQIIEGISEIFAKVKEEKLNSMVSTLIEKGKSLSNKPDSERNASNIALFVGSIVASRKTLREKVLKDFSNDISNKDVTKINPFSLRCIGEIGIRFSLAEDKSILDRILELVLSDNRLIFSSAAHSAGLIAANDSAIQTILPQIIDRMKKDIDRLSTWLSIIAKCLQRRQRVKTPAKIKFTDLFNYLVSLAGFTKETESTFVDCFDSILILKPSILASYFEKIALKNNASPILIRSICDYAENSLKTAEEVKPILAKIIPYLNPNEPSICSGAISFVNYSIRYEQLLSQIIPTFPTICKCVEVNDKHFFEEFYGTLSKKIDIGISMRVKSLDTISKLFSIIPDKLDIDIIINSCAKALDDPTNEVKIRTLSLIDQLCNNSISLPPIVKYILPKITNLEDANQPDYHQILIHLFAKLKVITKHSKVIAIEKILADITDKKLLKEYEDEFNQSISELNQKTTQSNNFNSKSVCYQLMLKYNREAAEIYV